MRRTTGQSPWPPRCRSRSSVAIRRANSAGMITMSAPTAAPDRMQITAKAPVSPAPSVAAQPKAAMDSTIADSSTRFAPQWPAARAQTGAAAAAATKNSSNSGPSHPGAARRAFDKEQEQGGGDGQGGRVHQRQQQQPPRQRVRQHGAKPGAAGLGAHPAPAAAHRKRGHQAQRGKAQRETGIRGGQHRRQRRRGQRRKADARQRAAFAPARKPQMPAAAHVSAWPTPRA